jgi:hypothetical protein
MQWNMLLFVTLASAHWCSATPNTAPYPCTHYITVWHSGPRIDDTCRAICERDSVLYAGQRGSGKSRPSQVAVGDSESLAPSTDPTLAPTVLPSFVRLHRLLSQCAGPVTMVVSQVDGHFSPQLNFALQPNLSPPTSTRRHLKLCIVASASPACVCPFPFWGR